MRPDIPKPDSQKTKAPLIAIFVIVALFILGYFVYVMLIPKQTQELNQTEQVQPK